MRKNKKLLVRAAISAVLLFGGMLPVVPGGDSMVYAAAVPDTYTEDNVTYTYRESYDNNIVWYYNENMDRSADVWYTDNTYSTVKDSVTFTGDEFPSRTKDLPTVTEDLRYNPDNDPYGFKHICFGKDISLTFFPGTKDVPLVGVDSSKGRIEAGNAHVVNGDTVYNALHTEQTARETADTALSGRIDTIDTKVDSKADVNADNIGANLKNAAGTAATAAEIIANEKAWGTALGTGSIANPSGMLVTDTAVHDELHPASDGSYIKSAQTTAQNFSALDTQVHTNVGDIAGLKDLSNLTEKGQKAIQTASQNAVKVSAGTNIKVDAVTASDGSKTYTVSAKTDGKVVKGDTGLVTGDTVNTAINKINSKIDDNKIYVDDELKKKANVDGSNIDKDKFSEAVAIGTVTKGENRAVSGDAVNEAISNISNAVNTKLEDKANTNLDNLTENGQKVIQNLAKGFIDIVDGHNIKVSKNSVNGKDIYSIDVSDKDIMDVMKPEIDKKADKDEVNKKFDGVDKSLNNKADRDAGNLTEKDISSWQDKLGNGTIEKGNTGLINGNTAYEAVKELKDSNPVQSDGKIITIGAKDTASVVDFRNSDGDVRVLTGIVTNINDRSSAANAGYVQDTARVLQKQMNSGYSKLNKNISKAAAGSNALAALHPMEYDPDDKMNFAVGYGHYKGANAAAIGAYYYPNANTMFSVGTTIGNGSPSVNAGISMKLGKGSVYNGVSKAEMASAINNLFKENQAIREHDKELEERLAKLEAYVQSVKK